MNKIQVNKPENLISLIIPANKDFPNNPFYPLLIYKKCILFEECSPSEVEEFLKKNGWHESWVNGIYDYHHYHSNTHEALVIYDGNCEVEFGGPHGHFFDVTKGDVIIIPGGISHKKIQASHDFTCIGAYPSNIKYDMNYGRKEEHPKVDKKIQKLDLPQSDPVFGEKGILFEYWK